MRAYFSFIIFACIASSACGQEPEKEDPIEIWTSWDLENESTQNNVSTDPVDPNIVDPITPDDPMRTACEDAFAIPLGAHEISFEDRPQTERCNGDLVQTAHVLAEIPPNHRLFASGATDIRESCGIESCGVEAQTNRTGEPKTAVIEIANYGEFESKPLRTEVRELSPYGTCESPFALWPDNIGYGDPKAGDSQFYNPCNLIESGYNEFFVVQVPLGFPPVEVRAIPRDRQNLSLSLQAITAFEDQTCSDPAPEQCAERDDAYFRSAPEAAITLDASVGGGRDPVHFLVAVTGSTSREDASYEIFMRHLEQDF